MRKSYKDQGEYILINHEFETMTEMADAIGMSYARVRELCIELGVKAITPLEQKVEYIRKANARREAVWEMAAVLNVSVYYIEKVAGDHGIKLVNPARKQVVEKKAADEPPTPKKDDLQIAKEKEALRKKLFPKDWLLGR